MSNDEKNENMNTPEGDGSAADPEQDQSEQDSFQKGPKFTQGSDPLAGVKKGATDVMASMDGKTVSMKVYVGTIIGIVVLMLLGQCNG